MLMSKNKKIIKLKDQYFLIHSELRLSKTISFLGFWSKDGIKWANHISSLILTTEEYQELKLL